MDIEVKEAAIARAMTSLQEYQKASEAAALSAELMAKVKKEQEEAHAAERLAEETRFRAMRARKASMAATEHATELAKQHGKYARV